MRLRPDLYYSCERGKADIAKIRRFCARVDCPHLRVRPRKNYHQEKRRSGNGEEEDDFPRVSWLRQGQIQGQIPACDLPAFNVLKKSPR